MIRILCAAFFAAACAGASAAGSDELWEVTTQMNIPGMPAGMGARTAQVCSEKGDARKAAQRNAEKCKITDYKESGNRITMTMSCPEGTGTLENTYNAARTEYKGTMKMTSAQGEMTMNMAGRKIGSCDAQQAKSEQKAKSDAMQQQVAKAQAEGAAMMAKIHADQIAGCEAALDAMDVRRFGAYANCDQDSYCKTSLADEQTKPVATKCMANRAEFCKRYQTMDGFLKANASAEGAQACKVSVDQIKGSLCPRAQQDNNLVFLGNFCPVEAKPMAQQHCVWRSYTSRGRDQWTEFCNAYLAHNSLEDEGKDQGSTPARTGIDPKQALQQGVTQGINKLRGLIGR